MKNSEQSYQYFIIGGDKSYIVKIYSKSNNGYKIRARSFKY